jgi:membrane-associated protein
MTAFLDRLLNLPAGVVYLLVGVLVFAEDALFVGFVLPGETAAILGGVAASLSHVSLTLITLTVVTAAVIGDSVGYEAGSRYGTRLLSLRPLERRRERLDAAEQTLARRGGLAVFLGRFVAFLRAMMPFLAGTSQMPYRGSWPTTPLADWSGDSATCCWATSPPTPTPPSRKPPAASPPSSSPCSSSPH